MIGPEQPKRESRYSTILFLIPVLVLLFAACRSPGLDPVAGEHNVPSFSPDLSPGDTLLITFPGATNLSGMHQVGSDGAITLPYIGVVTAVGKTPNELQAELQEQYSTELRDNQVLVSLASSVSMVYVTGAVLRPGRVQMTRPLTALEAIMEAGGYTEVANLEKVGIVRWEDGRNVRYTLNLEPSLQGQAIEPFYVKPRDIVEVPRKVQWF